MSDPFSERRATNSCFDAILDPLSSPSFRDSFWETRHLYIPGPEGKFDALGVSLQGFEECVAMASSGALKTAAVTDTGESIYTHIRPEDARSCFDAGMTLCVTGVDQHLRALRRLSLDATADLGLLGDSHCNAYLSPNGGGFGLHFDTQSVFILQVEGTKSWVCGAVSALPFPTELAEGDQRKIAAYRKRHPWAHITDPEDTAWCKYELTPGDLLYLPPGTWHQGKAAKYSLGVTLTCPTASSASILSGVLGEHLFSSLAWRRNLPPANASGGLLEAYLEERIAEFQRLALSITVTDLLKK